MWIFIAVCLEVQNKLPEFSRRVQRLTRRNRKSSSLIILTWNCEIDLKFLWQLYLYVTKFTNCIVLRMLLQLHRCWIVSEMFVTHVGVIKKNWLSWWNFLAAITDFWMWFHLKSSFCTESLVQCICAFQIMLFIILLFVNTLRSWISDLLDEWSIRNVSIDIKYDQFHIKRYTSILWEAVIIVHGHLQHHSLPTRYQLWYNGYCRLIKCWQRLVLTLTFTTLSRLNDLRKFDLYFIHFFFLSLSPLILNNMLFLTPIFVAPSSEFPRLFLPGNFVICPFQDQVLVLCFKLNIETWIIVIRYAFRSLIY